MPSPLEIKVQKYIKKYAKKHRLNDEETLQFALIVKRWYGL